MALRLSEGLGVVRESLEYMIYSLPNFTTWNLTYFVSAPCVPAHELFINCNGVAKGLIALGIGDVDVIPRWQDEHRVVVDVAG